MSWFFGDMLTNLECLLVSCLQMLDSIHLCLIWHLADQHDQEPLLSILSSHNNFY
jgi:hypothetical protein